MGYTHYWRRPLVLDKTKFEAAVVDFSKLLPEIAGKGIELAGGDGTGSMKIKANLLWFNGKGDLAHETFHIGQEMKADKWDEPKGDKYFAFCKTAYKPYDLAVTAALIVFKQHFRDDLTVSSDGDITEWADAVALCEKVLGYGKFFELK